MVNAIVSLWDPLWANTKDKRQCDSHIVVNDLNMGRARDSILAFCARNVWLLTAMFNVSLTVSNIQGAKNNVADLLSRWYHTSDNEGT